MSKLVHKLIQRTALSGLSHHDYAFVAKQIEVGDELILSTPDNRYDQYAVAVSYQSEDEDLVQIGWIPKGQNEMLHRILKAGAEIRCKVISHETAKPLDSRLYVGNYLTISE